MPETAATNTPWLKRTPLGSVWRSPLGAFHRPRLRFNLICLDKTTGETKWRWRGGSSSDCYGLAVTDDNVVLFTPNYNWHSDAEKSDPENTKPAFSESGGSYFADTVNVFVFDSRGCMSKAFECKRTPFLGNPYSGCVIADGKINLLGKTTNPNLINLYRYDLDGSNESITGIAGNLSVSILTQDYSGGYSLCGGSSATYYDSEGISHGESLPGWTACSVYDGTHPIVIGRGNVDARVYIYRDGETKILGTVDHDLANLHNLKIRYLDGAIYAPDGKKYSNDDFSEIGTFHHPGNAAWELDDDGSYYVFSSFGSGGIIKYNAGNEIVWNTADFDGGAIHIDSIYESVFINSDSVVLAGGAS